MSRREGDVQAGKRDMTKETVDQQAERDRQEQAKAYEWPGDFETRIRRVS